MTAFHPEVEYKRTHFATLYAAYLVVVDDAMADIKQELLRDVIEEREPVSLAIRVGKSVIGAKPVHIASIAAISVKELDILLLNAGST